MIGDFDAVLVDTVRSPMGRGALGGALSKVHPVELLAQVVTGLLGRVGIDPAEVEDVITGCVGRIGEQASTIGRAAWLAADLPPHVPSTTVERANGASQQAVHFAVQGVMAGMHDVVIAAGVESMSRVPAGSNLLGRDPYGPILSRRYAFGPNSQSMAAEVVAQRWDIGRDEMDAYAEQSHQRAAAVSAAGEFRREIVPIAVPSAAGTEWVTDDETINPAMSTDLLREIPVIFGDDGCRERDADIAWNVTAGNSAQAADAAVATLVMSERRARQLNLAPRARFRSLSVTADDPDSVMPGPITATDLALKRAGISVEQLDHVEVNETNAVVPLAWLAAVGRVHQDFLNPRGGAIALGHPHGASGIRLMTTMLTALEDTGGRFGLQAEWEAGGSATATIIERL